MAADAWLSFAYQFGVGGVLFVLPVLAGLKHKVIRMDRAIDRRLLVSVGLVYAFYFLLQGIWTFLALPS